MDLGVEFTGRSVNDRDGLGRGFRGLPMSHPAFAILSVALSFAAAPLLGQVTPVPVNACASGPITLVTPGNVAPNPMLQVVDAWVDPAAGNNMTASVGGGAFKTIQAAADALSLALLPGQHGRVQLLAGRYGSGTGNSSFTQGSGELWPVTVPPNISIVGVNALNTCLDVSLNAGAPSGIQLPHPRTGNISERRAALVFEGAGHDQSTVARITIVNADIGVLVRGNAAANPVLSNLCITQSQVAVLIYSEGGLGSGVHRPRIVNCTLAHNGVGVAAMNASGTLGAPARSRPAIVNSIFWNDWDLEGINCSGVASSAFSPVLSNTSTAIAQPASLPTPVFNPRSWAGTDLFLGLLTWPANAGTPEPTDWRLTYVTQSGANNPARAAGTGLFPILLDNGTFIDILLPGFEVGSGATGAGSEGSATSSGWDLGYEPLPSFCVGGSMPLTDAFGLSLTGSSSAFTVMHLFLEEPAAINFLFVTLPPPGLAPYVAGSVVPRGMNESPVTTGFGAPLWLDMNLGILDASALLNAGLAGSLNGGVHFSIPVNPALMPVSLQLALQPVQVLANGQLRVCSAARCAITP